MEGVKTHAGFNVCVDFLTLYIHRPQNNIQQASTAIALVPCAFALVPFATSLNCPQRSAPYQRKIAMPLQDFFLKVYIHVYMFSSLEITHSTRSNCLGALCL